MADIFFSYASEDRECLEPLVLALEAAGWNVWWDREIPAGPRFDQVIQEEIANASCVMMAWSEQPGELDTLLAAIREHVGSRQADGSEQDGSQQADGSDPDAAPDASRPKTDLPSIAVLPFSGPSDERDDVSLTEGIRDALISTLSHSVFKVVAGQASDVGAEPQEVGNRHGVRYLVSGNVQRSGERARVSLRLTETKRGEAIWTQRYEQSGEDLFELQDRLVEAIRGALIESIHQAEAVRLRDVPDEQLDAFGLCARATRNMATDRASRDRQLMLLRRAVRLDPDFGWAHAMLAHTIALLVHNQFSRDPASDRVEGLAHADRSMTLASVHPAVLGLASLVHCYLGDEADAVRLAERQTEILGYDTDALFAALNRAGRSEEVIERASRQTHPDLWSLSVALMMTSRHEQGLECMLKYLAEFPQSYLGWAHAANMLGHLDRLDEALEAVDKLKAMVPTYTVALHEKSIRDSLPKRDELVPALVDGLKKLNIG